MKIVGLDAIMAALDEGVALAAIEQAFRDFSAGRAQVAAVGHLVFEAPPGDCHIKSAYLAGEPFYAVKVASSFERNPDLGLSSSQGFVAILSSETGELAGILNDAGWLTHQRTAMAGVVAGRLIARAGGRVLGIVGTGTQARLQARMISRYLGLDSILLAGRDDARLQNLAAETGGRPVSMEQLCAEADLIVTTTAATQPLLRDEWIRPGARIIAVGADGSGKRELDPAILSRATVIADSRLQCVDHGETSWAIADGLLKEDDVLELGDLLLSPTAFPRDAVVVVDLTGVAVQDAAIARTVWNALARPS
jgi:ornithine cyclodeaminase